MVQSAFIVIAQLYLKKVVLKVRLPTPTLYLTR